MSVRTPFLSFVLVFFIASGNEHIDIVYNIRSACCVQYIKTAFKVG